MTHSFLALTAVALIASASHAGGAPVAYVVDANNQDVGQSSFDSQVLVKVGSNGVVVAQITRTGFVASEPVFFYTTNDCTGQKYIGASSLPPQAFFRPESNRLLFADIAKASFMTLGSVRQPGEGCYGKNLSFSAYVSPAASFDVGRFTPPFSVLFRP